MARLCLAPRLAYLRAEEKQHHGDKCERNKCEPPPRPPLCDECMPFQSNLAQIAPSVVVAVLPALELGLESHVAQQTASVLLEDADLVLENVRLLV